MRLQNFHQLFICSKYDESRKDESRATSRTPDNGRAMPKAPYAFVHYGKACQGRVHPIRADLTFSADR